MSTITVNIEMLFVKWSEGNKNCSTDARRLELNKKKMSNRSVRPETVRKDSLINFIVSMYNNQSTYIEYKNYKE